MTLREAIKEKWQRSTASHQYLFIGADLLRIRNEKLYKKWGYANIRLYLKDELHMAPVVYGDYIAAVKRAHKLDFDSSDYDVENKHTVRAFLKHAKVSKSKEELFQRLEGTYEPNPIQTKYRLGPFVMSVREMHLLWAAKRITGDSTRKFEKDDLLAVINFFIAQTKERGKS